MKIFFISRGIPSKGGPQWGNFELDQAKALAKRGHEVVILSVDRRWFRLKKERFLRPIGFTHSKIDGIDTYNLYIPFLVPLLMRIAPIFIFFSRILIDVLFKYVVNIHGMPDVVHGHYAWNIVDAVYLKRKYGLVVVGTEHWSRVLIKMQSKQIQTFGKHGYPFVDNLIAVSPALKTAIQSSFDISATVIPNVVDTSVFLMNKDFRRNDRFTFVSVGRLENGKGFDYLIRAFYEAHFANDVYLKIIGTGECKNSLLKLISELGLSAQIELTGQKTRKEIASYFAQGNAFVLSSHYETFSVVCIEAMAMGLPIIATDCGGPRDIVTEQSGVLVPVKDIAKLSNSMIEMRENSIRYDSELISAECKRRYSSEIVSKQIEDIYIKAIGKRNSSIC